MSQFYVKCGVNPLERVIEVLSRFVPKVAVPAGRDNYEKLDIGGMARFVDFWNLMVSAVHFLCFDCRLTKGGLATLAFLDL